MFYCNIKCARSAWATHKADCVPAGDTLRVLSGHAMQRWLIYQKLKN